MVPEEKLGVCMCGQVSSSFRGQVSLRPGTITQDELFLSLYTVPHIIYLSSTYYRNLIINLDNLSHLIVGLPTLLLRLSLFTRHMYRPYIFQSIPKLGVIRSTSSKQVSLGESLWVRLWFKGASQVLLTLELLDGFCIHTLRFSVVVTRNCPTCT